MTRLDLVPPFIARWQARSKRGSYAFDRKMSLSDLAAASGLHRATIIRLSKLTSWDTVPFGTADRFAKACGINLLKLNGNHAKRVILCSSDEDAKFQALTEKWLVELAEWAKNG